MKVAFVQLEPVLGDPHQTLGRVQEQLPLIADCDLAVFPELCNSGYNFVSPEQARASAETVDDSLLIRMLHEQCVKNNMHIVTGLNERDRAHLYNTAVLIGPRGVIGKYRKLHLFQHEKDFFVPGDLGLPVFDIGPCKLGMLICFDWRFPEAWRVLALQGADIICHPSNLVIPGQAQRAVPYHAMFNKIFTITANRIGVEGNLKFTGLSFIANPSGETPLMAEPDRPAVGVVEIDPTVARDKQVTSRNDIFLDRRPEFYGLLASRSSKS